MRYPHSQQCFKIPTPGAGAALYDSGLTYAHADWLGSVRFVSTTGRGKSYDRAYGPYGESYGFAGAAGKADAEGFTGNREDIVTGSTGLYDFVAREYSSAQSRFVSPDPLGAEAADPASPQTWNKYAYVSNDPLAATDPLGLEMWVEPFGDIAGMEIDMIGYDD